MAPERGRQRSVAIKHYPFLSRAQQPQYNPLLSQGLQYSPFPLPRCVAFRQRPRKLTGGHAERLKHAVRIK